MAVLWIILDTAPVIVAEKGPGEEHVIGETYCVRRAGAYNAVVRLRENYPSAEAVEKRGKIGMGGGKKMPRIGRHTLNMKVAELMAERSTCTRAKVGCVISVSGRIISTGYAGAPSGVPHCIDVGCEIGSDGGCSTTLHAEAGAIAFAARKGVVLEGSTLYVTLSPCRSCAKLILTAGIKEVFYRKEYRDTSGIELLKKAGVKTEWLI